MQKPWIVILLSLLAAALLLGIIIFSLKPDSANIVNDQAQKTVLNDTITPTITMPTPTINPNIQYFATLNTSAGKIEIKFNLGQTPQTVGNFVKLAKSGFYNNTVFHRVMSGFMIQGGDPKGDGTGGPGYTFADEPFTGDYTRGTVAMANAGPNTNGSQFFIMHETRPLPKNYVIFGQVVSGMETVDKIATAPVTAGISGENSSPVNPVKILTVDISEKSVASPSSAVSP
jgi:cyclophilin family peptidyl-prolyl cis-trans isomerase